MAESKPTKLQMAKEIQYLIAAAQDMSAVMDLDPVIKTDYLIDLKNKTVTATHLQNVVANLQADIKRDAKMIEPQDKFQPDTHKVLADLNVKVPRPAAKEEVVEEVVEDETEDDVMPTPSPPMEEEVEKKEKEASTPKKSPSPVKARIKVSAKEMDPILFSEKSIEDKIQDVADTYNCELGKATSIFNAHVKYREKTKPKK